MAKKIYYQEEIETMPVEQLKALQEEKFIKQVKYVYDNNEYYRNLMEEGNIVTGGDLILHFGIVAAVVFTDRKITAKADTVQYEENTGGDNTCILISSEKKKA